MRKTILGSLTALTLAAGLGCAKDVPVYSQSEIIAQTDEIIVSKEVYWNAGRMKLAVRVVNNGTLESETVWTRDEPIGSGECSRLSLYVMRPFSSHMPDGTPSIEGSWFDSLSDEGCDGTFENGGPELYVFSNDPAVIEEQTQQWRRQLYSSYMQTITSNFDVERFIEDWHRAKEL
ncbi:MAG: hypothetical protein KJ955_08210 [Nanoarchaeota archaeon]|nr:hypothetical protein [Nanoarchaeota archaeon]